MEECWTKNENKNRKQRNSISFILHFYVFQSACSFVTAMEIEVENMENKQ